MKASRISYKITYGGKTEDSRKSMTVPTETQAITIYRQKMEENLYVDVYKITQTTKTEKLSP